MRMDHPYIVHSMYKLVDDYLLYKWYNYHNFPDRDLYIYHLYRLNYGDIRNWVYIRVDNSVVDRHNFQYMNKQQFHRSRGIYYSVRMDWDSKDQQLLQVFLKEENS